MVKKSTKTKRVDVTEMGSSQETETIYSGEKGILERFLGALEVGEPIVYKELSVFPIFETDRAIKGKIEGKHLVMMKEALDGHILEINDTGVVGELEFDNKSQSTHILIVEGEVVKGGKQNRTINVTFILGPKTKKRVPTSCVQQHRWTSGMGSFEPANVYLDYNARSTLCETVSCNMVASSGRSYTSDQHALWNSVGNSLSMTDSSNKSADILNIYEVNEEEIKEILNKITSEMKEDSSKVGVFCSFGKKVFVEIFDDNDFFKPQQEKILKSSIVELLKDGKEKNEMNLDKVIDILNNTKEIKEFQVFDTPDKGKTCRFNMAGYMGTALLYSDRIIHFSLISK